MAEKRGCGRVINRWTVRRVYFRKVTLRIIRNNTWSEVTTTTLVKWKDNSFIVWRPTAHTDDMERTKYCEIK